MLWGQKNLPPLLYFFCVCNKKMWFCREVRGFRVSKNCQVSQFLLTKGSQKQTLKKKKWQVNWILNIKSASQGFGRSMEKTTKQLTIRLKCQPTPRSNQVPFQSRLVQHIAIRAKEILIFLQMVWSMEAIVMSILFQRNKTCGSPEVHQLAWLP